eukprot:TRINITY_DN48628_c0_g1_i1.p3 TRINITY_DN48628_c0_g1~~TRINITY_DN48628_c0_g1_i1.p3  ORF type:complete len:119 (+),score=13.61 TRINITY_DN48628_c0_g1_i1:146-502(+)
MREIKTWIFLKIGFCPTTLFDPQILIEMRSGKQQRRKTVLSKNKIKDPYAEREAANYENPIPSRELITEVLENSPGPLSFKKIIGRLHIDTAEKKEALRRRLRAMERDGQLIVKYANT